MQSAGWRTTASDFYPEINGSVYTSGLILIFVEQEIILARIVRPNILNTFINLSLVFHLLQVLDDL